MVFCLPLTTLPVPSSGWPGYLIWPFSPSSLNQATHFSMFFCICSGDADVSLPRNRNVNSLIVFAPYLGMTQPMTFERGERGHIFLHPSGSAADLSGPAPPTQDN